MDGHVVVVCEVVEGGVGDGDVDVAVPGHDLLVPPPAEQGAVHEKGLCAEGAHGLEVGLHEGDEVQALEVGGECAPGEARVEVRVPACIVIRTVSRRCGR